MLGRLRQQHDKLSLVCRLVLVTTIRILRLQRFPRFIFEFGLDARLLALFIQMKSSAAPILEYDRYDTLVYPLSLKHDCTASHTSIQNQVKIPITAMPANKIRRISIRILSTSKHERRHKCTDKEGCRGTYRRESWQLEIRCLRS